MLTALSHYFFFARRVDTLDARIAPLITSKPLLHSTSSWQLGSEVLGLYGLIVALIMNTRVTDAVCSI